jgi:hypothetical protein
MFERSTAKTIPEKAGLNLWGIDNLKKTYKTLVDFNLHWLLLKYPKRKNTLKKMWYFGSLPSKRTIKKTDRKISVFQNDHLVEIFILKI